LSNFQCIKFGYKRSYNLFWESFPLFISRDIETQLNGVDSSMLVLYRSNLLLCYYLNRGRKIRPKYYVIDKHMMERSRSGVSNTLPAGRMLPTKGVYAAHVPLKNYKVWGILMKKGDFLAFLPTMLLIKPCT